MGQTAKNVVEMSEEEATAVAGEATEMDETTDKGENEEDHNPANDEAAVACHDLSSENFNKLLTEFEQLTAKSMDVARAIAEISILSFEESGNLNYFYAFLNRMEDTKQRNYVRMEAYKTWFAAHAPAVYDKDRKKWIKDKSKGAMPFNTANAMLKPFWDFSVETPAELFYDHTIIARLEGLVKSYEGKKKTAANADAASTLKRVREFTANLRKPQAA